MKRLLQALALALGVGAIVFWLSTGAHRGWSRTSVPVKFVDDVTGLEGVRYQERFVPGLDFLVGALLGAGLLAGASVLLRKTKEPPTESPIA